jgi:hypothetical protein
LYELYGREDKKKYESNRAEIYYMNRPLGPDGEDGIALSMPISANNSCADVSSFV